MSHIFNSINCFIDNGAFRSLIIYSFYVELCQIVDIALYSTTVDLKSISSNKLEIFGEIYLNMVISRTKFRVSFLIMDDDVVFPHNILLVSGMIIKISFIIDF